MNAEIAEKGVILIVDDTPTNLDMLLDLLEADGFKVVVAEDGERAIALAEYAPPDLILLDVLMPGIDGFETCRRLKANSATQEIPIIFLTGVSDSLDKVKGLNLGAVDYITKPLNHEEVLARVNIHIRLQNLTRRLTEQNERLEKEIQQRQEAEDKIREQAALLNITTDAILVRDLNNIIQYWNQGAEHVYGWTAEEAIAQNANQLLYRPDLLNQLEMTQSHLIQRGTWQGELHQVNKQGQEIIVASRWTLMRDAQEQPKFVLIVNTDITEKKQLESQFLRTQRLESLGTLAGGIAHDLNNILTPILTTAQLLQLKFPQADEQSQHLLRIIESNTRRGASLVKQVLQFARGVEGKRALVQVKHLIHEVQQIAVETFPKSIEFLVNVEPELGLVSGDATHLHQVLLNLLVNARDAMPQGGTLTLSVENLMIDEHNARMNLDASVGSYIAITVKDTGIGMSAETADRIFEPFFTTKEFGQGTGLGLSTVRGVVKSHGGFIDVVSKVGEGTEFRVFLPTVEAAAPLDVEPLNASNGGAEWILVVDDEREILEATKASLEAYNYHVLTANSGIEAISLCAQYKHLIAVALVDMMMPSMDGPTTIQTLQKINPLIKAIAISGFVPSNKLNEASGIQSFIAKPFTIPDLLQTLQSVLNQPLTDPMTFNLIKKT